MRRFASDLRLREIAQRYPRGCIRLLRVVIDTASENLSDAAKNALQPRAHLTARSQTVRRDSEVVALAMRPPKVLPKAGAPCELWRWLSLQRSAHSDSGRRGNTNAAGSQGAGGETDEDSECRLDRT